MPCKQGMLTTDLAYLAGIVDGEGCITINRSSPRLRTDQRRRNKIYHASATYTLALTVGMVEPAQAVLALQDAFGGGIYFRKYQLNRQSMVVWSIASHRAVDALFALLPYLRIKRYHALLGIQFQQHKRVEGNSGNSAKYGRLRTPDVVTIGRDAFFCEMQSLNHTGGVPSL